MLVSHYWLVSHYSSTDLYLYPTSTTDLCLYRTSITDLCLYLTTGGPESRTCGASWPRLFTSVQDSFSKAAKMEIVFKAIVNVFYGNEKCCDGVLKLSKTICEYIYPPDDFDFCIKLIVLSPSPSHQIVDKEVC